MTKMILTCNKVCVMELADGVSLVPGNAVPEVAVEYRESFLGQDPCVADVYLSKQTAFQILISIQVIGYIYLLPGFNLLLL